MIYHDRRHLFCLVVIARHSHFTKPSGVFLFCKKGIRIPQSPVATKVRVDFCSAKVELIIPNQFLNCILLF